MEITEDTTITKYNNWYDKVNEPRIGNVNEWLIILKNEIDYNGFDFIGKILITIYNKPNKFAYMSDIQKEIGTKGINFRVGEFRDRIMKLDNIVVKPQLRWGDDDDAKGRGWNIPFYSREEKNDSRHFSWCLRPELIEAMEILIPQLKEKTNMLNQYEPICIYDKMLETKEFIEVFDNDVAIANVDTEIKSCLKPKKDYVKLNTIKKKIGDSGERAVVRIEKNFLIENNCKTLAHKVRIVESDGYGYDVISYDLNGQEKHIEVKTTKLEDKNVKFYLSAYEWEILNLDELYELYYLFNIDKDKPLYRIYKRKELLEVLNKYMKPSQYYVEFGLEPHNEREKNQ